MKSTEIQRILVVKLGSIGDILMASPVPRALKERLPHALVAWLVEEKGRDVAEGNPYVDEVVAWPRARWQQMLSQGRQLTALREFRALVRDLRARRFDLVIDLHAGFWSGLIAWLSGAPFRLGRSDGRDGNVFFLNYPARVRHDTVRASESDLDVLTQGLGIRPSSYDLVLAVPHGDQEWAERFLEDAGLPPGAPIATLAPAARHDKRWTEAGFAEVSDRLYTEYNLGGVLLGGPADLPMIERIASMCRHRPIIAAGRATYRQSAALVRRSRILIGVDTGLVRVGLAMKTPTIALFGPTEPGPLRQEERITVVQRPAACPPSGRRSGRTDAVGLDAIVPDDVMEAIGEWLHSPAPWANK